MHELKRRGYRADYVREVARSQAEKVGHFPANICEQWPILMRQVRREAEIATMSDIIVCDAASFLAPGYAANFLRTLESDGKIDPNLWHQFLDILDDGGFLVDTYDLIFVPPTNLFDYDPGIRVQKNKSESDKMDRKVRGFLDLLDVPFVILDSDPNRWVAQVVDAIVGIAGAPKGKPKVLAEVA